MHPTPHMSIEVVYSILNTVKLDLYKNVNIPSKQDIGRSIPERDDFVRVSFCRNTFSSCKSKIRELQFSFFIDQKILRLQIAMQNPPRMTVTLITVLEWVKNRLNLLNPRSIWKRKILTSFMSTILTCSMYHFKSQSLYSNTKNYMKSFWKIERFLT